MAQSAFSVLWVLKFSFSFFWQNFRIIIHHTWIAMVAGCVIFYLSTEAYLAELKSFLAAPTAAHASIILATAAVAVLLLLFSYTVASAAVLNLVLGYERSPGWLHIGDQEYRLYAAVLRFALVMTLPITLGCVVGTQFNRVAPGFQFAVETILGVLLLLVAVRLGFLLPALAMAKPRGPVLRQSWTMSKENLPRLFAIALTLLLPGIVLEMGGELLGRLATVFPPVTETATMQAHIQLFGHIAPSFAILLSLSVLLNSSLQAIASVGAYRVLTRESALGTDAR